MIHDGPDEPARIVERLVGPADPELSCEECFDYLDAYVELELAGPPTPADTSMLRMRAHLRGCSACRDDHDSLLALLQSDRSDPA